MHNPDGTIMYESYSQNRATLHLHGGNTPWISDGTPHQWITPAGEATAYPKGVSVEYVPDMWFVNGNVVPNTAGQTTAPVAGASNNPGDGSMTFYYTNQQSARLLFYHDHSYGITRLNVYAGEAAGYIIEDATEKALISQGIIPSTELPLIIQDKTFVPDTTTPFTNMFGTFASQLAFQDPTWNTQRWGTKGELWYPHVYMTMQNPGDPSGMNQFGRWQYGPWFWPPTNPTHGPVANPYYNPLDPNNPMEPAQIPGVPNISAPGEAFLDTPVINGIAYPYLEIQPQAYRFRILNAADDRSWNLQLYIADNTTTTWNGRTNTEVKMVPASFNSTYPADWPTDGRDGGVPDPTRMGPSFIQIGTEGGFLPAPATIANQPIDWNWNMGDFDFSNIAKHSLLLAPAERADVIVDFSQYAGQTIILYNDAPAPIPASDPRQDYYTGNPDQTDSGGTQSTIAGYGPNTRTIMQIKVAATTPAAPFNTTALEQAFASTATTQGVFAASQNPIIVPEAAYSSAYNQTFTNNYGRIFNTTFTYTPINKTTPLTLDLQPKSMHDEMGGAFDAEYGRMTVQLGVEIPKSSPLTQNTILYNYFDSPTEVLTPDVTGTQIGTLSDGTQIWRITHNGVDTHPMHWHMFDVQLINRVAWDNKIREPDANELGWKDTIRINPLQDTYIALRPVVPTLPFDVPNSIRPQDPTMPLGTILKTNIFIQDPTGQPITEVNHLINYGYEYVWHCHILAHEEMDAMRPIAVAVPPRDPSNLVATTSQGGNRATLTWKDNSLSETSFTIQRADDQAFTTGVVTIQVDANVVTYIDTAISRNHVYYYRIQANNLVGDTYQYAAPAIGFPTVQVNSNWSSTTILAIINPPNQPTNLQATQVTAEGIALAWTDKSNNEAGFQIQRSTSSQFTNPTTFTVGADITTYTDTTTALNTQYYYRVLAYNAGGNSAWSNTVNALTPVSAAASNLVFLGVTGSGAKLTWNDNSMIELGFILQRSTTNTFPSNPFTINIPANSGKTVTFYDASVSRGQVYYYRVAAVLPSGILTWSNTVRAAT
jgi:FtsP/CotA-like multicopper oxidase with cupredoxin domain